MLGEEPCNDIVVTRVFGAASGTRHGFRNSAALANRSNYIGHYQPTAHGLFASDQYQLY